MRQKYDQLVRKTFTFKTKRQKSTKTKGQNNKKIKRQKDNNLEQDMRSPGGFPEPRSYNDERNSQLQYRYLPSS